jgi:membrane-bound lytic murein transglycosylase D
MDHRTGPRSRPWGWALMAMLLLLLPARAGNAASDPTPAVADSLRPAPGAIEDGQTAYQTAWTLRLARQHIEAIHTLDLALGELGETMADPATPDAERAEAAELHSRLSGLRDMTRDELRSMPAVETGNEADPQVLNAPATEDIELQLNQDVYRYIEFFTGSGRSVFERWLKRSGRYMELFRSVLQKEGLPPELVHLVFVESGFNVHARSYAAAVGPWQFIRSTGKLFGLTVNQWVDERKDPEKSTVAAARYLKHLYTIFGDWPLALASYNAGEGTVLRAIKRQGTTNYWDLRLPQQTEDYVPQFMAALAISRDPQKYGFDTVPLDEPMAFDEVAFRGPVDLRALAKLSDCTYEELRQLNPAVLRHAALGPNGVTVLRVPPGKGEILSERLQAGAPMPAVDLTLTHRVQRGETLQRIADRYHVSAQRLASANGIGKKNPLKRGMVLKVPAGARSARPELLAEVDSIHTTAYVPERRIRVTPQYDADSDAEGRLTHRVRRGETLQGIADRYGVTASEIMRWNRLTTTRVRPGARLKIRTGDAALDSTRLAGLDSTAIVAPEPLPAAAGKAAARVVTVRRGDTLSGIANRHGVTVGALKQANGLKSSTIRTGQKLRIPQG